MQAFVMTSAYEGDEWAIAKLEERYNIKFIIYSTLVNDVICGNLLPFGDQVLTVPPETPSHYIFLWHNGVHYKIIKYNGQSIFTFATLPEALKMKILRCFTDHATNDFSIIPEFRQYARSSGYIRGGTRKRRKRRIH
jgi:hypothetical protein